MSFSERRRTIGEILLLRVVCRIRKYTRVKTTMDAITALDYHAVLICCQKFIIKNDCPLSVEDFSLAMCHKGRADSFLAGILCRKGFEGIRELILANLRIYTQLRGELHLLSPNKQHVQRHAFDLLVRFRSQDKWGKAFYC